MTVYINGTTGYSGPVGTIGDLTTTGNTTLGDASGDTLTINGSTTTLTQGTANGVAYLNGSKALTTGSALVFDGSTFALGVTAAGAYVNSTGQGTSSLWMAGTSGSASLTQFGGELRFNTGGTANTAATGATERMRLDSSGNLGLGVTPSAWFNEVSPALQIYRCTIGQNTGFDVTSFSTNAYYSAANTWRYIGSAAATKYDQYSGSHRFYISNSGTAGNTISFTQAMTLTAGGNLVVNNTASTGSPAGKLQVWENTASSSYVCIDARSGQSGGLTPLAYTTTLIEGSGANTGSSGNVAIKMHHNDNLNLQGDLSFWTKNNLSTQYERMRITSAGYVGIGTNDPQSLLHVSAGSAASVYTGLTLQNTDNSSSGQGVQIVFKNSSYSGVEAQKYGYLRYKAATNYGEQGFFVFGTNNGYNVAPVDRLSISANGDVYTNLNGGSLYTRAGGVYAAITDLGWTAPIQVQETGTGTTAYRYIPMISQTSTSSSGYRQHTVFGSSRGSVWGDAFIAVGGNDSYPTLAFYFSYTGVFTAPSTKNFVIPHPLPELNSTQELVHAAIEAPRADLIYRGVVQLVDGQAVVNVDADSRMTEGTLEALCRNVQCFTTNESDWTPVRGTVSGNVLTIQAQDPTSQAQVSWMVIGERKDENVMRTYDEQGRFIVERPAKQATPT